MLAAIGISISVGAGLAGISAATFFLAAGVEIALLEKTFTVDEDPLSPLM